MPSGARLAASRGGVLMRLTPEQVAEGDRRLAIIRAKLDLARRNVAKMAAPGAHCLQSIRHFETTVALAEAQWVKMKEWS